MRVKKSLPKHLPLPQGPYVPGSIDVLTGYSKDGCLVRLYYPSSLETKVEEESSKWIPWIPHQKYVDGFARVINIWVIIIHIYVWICGGVTYVPAVDAALPYKKRRWPVVVFSHGFGASRFLCSSIGTEMASWGYMFAAVEHRDNSACATFYYDSPESRDEVKATWIPHHRLKIGPDHYAKRNKQLHERKREVIQALDLLFDINNGEDNNILPTKLSLSDFKDCLDLDSVCMMGHSFGGATSLLALGSDARFKTGVILDGWMFPLKEEKALIVKQSLIFINTQTFHIASNLAAIDTYVSDVPAPYADRSIFTIKHTTHESQTDTPHVLGYWLDWFMRKLDPLIGTRINNHIILRYLSQQFGVPQDVKESTEYLKQFTDIVVEGPILYTKQVSRKLGLT